MDARSKLRDAVSDGLKRGSTDRSNGWAGWEFFTKHLSPHGVRPKEARCVANALLNDAKGFRQDVVEFLIGEKGRRAWEKAYSEREFHRALRAGARQELRELLDAINSFELFSRLCQDAFQDCLREMTRQAGSKTPLVALARKRK